MLWVCEHPKKTEKQENMKILKPEKNVEITLKLKKKKVLLLEVRPANSSD